MAPLATDKQKKAIRALLHKQGLLQNKDEIVLSFTNNRTSHISEMNIEEAKDLLGWLFGDQKEKDKAEAMKKKLFAMCHEIGWISVKTYVQGSEVTSRKDYSRVHGWVEKYGYLKKPLGEYVYKELPKLISQFEFNVYNPYIQSLSKR